MTIAPTREPEPTLTAEPTEVLIPEARRRGRRQRLVVGLLVTTAAVGILLGFLLTWSGGRLALGAGPFGSYGAGSPSMSVATEGAFKSCDETFTGPGSGMSVLAAYPSTAGLLTSAAHDTSWYNPGRPSKYAGYPSSARMVVCYLAGSFAVPNPTGVRLHWTRGVYVIPPWETPHHVGPIPLVIGMSRFRFVPPPTIS